MKDYKSGWKAFWYNSTAKLFKLSLKEKYDPMNVSEDHLIEDILQRSFIDGVIELKPSKLNINYVELNKIPIVIPKPKAK